MGEAAITSAFEAVNNFMLSEEQRLAYINREMSIMDYNTNIKASREEGLEEGRKEGLTYMVRNCLAVGTPMEYIRKASGLTDEAILALKDK